jgi:hypothetical protein
MYRKGTWSGHSEVQMNNVSDVEISSGISSLPPRIWVTKLSCCVVRLLKPGLRSSSCLIIQLDCFLGREAFRTFSQAYCKLCSLQTLFITNYSRYLPNTFCRLVPFPLRGVDAGPESVLHRHLILRTVTGLYILLHYEH